MEARQLYVKINIDEWLERGIFIDSNLISKEYSL